MDEPQVEQESKQPVLYFSGWGFDGRSDKFATINFGKRLWVARPLGRHIVFRDVEDADERSAWFLLQPLTEGEFEASNHSNSLSYLNQEWFVRRWKQGGIGRCVLHVTEDMAAHQCLYYLFRPDGTGLSVDDDETTLMEFGWNKGTSLSWAELLVADPEEMRSLCKLLFDTQVKPHIAGACLAPNGMECTDDEDIPYFYVSYFFERGSERELYRLTTAILHSHPDLFEQVHRPVTIKYRAKTTRKRAYMAIEGWHGEDPFPFLGRLQSLCDLALRLNTFVGETRLHGINTRSNLNHYVHTISVIVQPPSAHERAESLLMLADWLEGKVREPKRLRLLGVEAE